MTKKTISLILGAALCLSLLAACGTPAADPTPTPTQEPALTGEELAAHYAEAITSARTDEDNQSFTITTAADELGDYGWESLGFASSDVEAFAVSLSLINVHAYCVGAFKPVEGKAETVMNGLQAYIDRTVQSFTNYLPDQLTIAENAVLEQLDDGTVLIVMCTDQDTVRDAIVAAL